MHDSQDRTPAPQPVSPPDALIVGDGVIGLSIAAAISERGGSARVIGRARPGLASTAAAGLLSASVGEVPAGIRQFVFGSRDAYPALVARIQAATGVSVHLGPQGILEVAGTAKGFAELRRSVSADVTALDATVLADLEPALAPMAGAILHASDTIVDPVQLLRGLRALVERDAAIDVIDAGVMRLDLGGRTPAAISADGQRHEGRSIVLAAGAWVAQLDGLLRPLPIEPVRGQILALTGCPLRHAVMDGHEYLVPRGGLTIAGSTMERVGFDPDITEPALTRIREAAQRLCPRLGHAPQHAAWAGLRPATPDFLPILGCDPERSSLIYACGHSRNGILLAPSTAVSVAALVLGAEPPYDLAPFSVTRFS